MKIFFSILLMFSSIACAADENGGGQGNNHTKASKATTASSVALKNPVVSNKTKAATASPKITIPCPIVDKVVSSDDTFESGGYQWTVGLSSFDGGKLTGLNTPSEMGGVGGMLLGKPFKIRVNNKKDDTYICTSDANSKVFSCTGYVIPVSHDNGDLTKKQVEQEVSYRFVFNSDHKKCQCSRDKIVCDK